MSKRPRASSKGGASSNSAATGASGNLNMSSFGNLGGLDSEQLNDLFAQLAEEKARREGPSGASPRCRAPAARPVTPLWR